MQSTHAAGTAVRENPRPRDGERRPGETARGAWMGSNRKGQFAFCRDALMLFVVALDPIPRITDVPIGLRQQLANLVGAGHRSLKHPWQEYHGLPNQKLVLHGKIPSVMAKSGAWAQCRAICRDAAAELRARRMPVPVDSRLPIG
jgi:hypothetical protein